MFTGLVATIGAWKRASALRRGSRAMVQTSLGLHEPLVLGESIAVDGVCLTVDRILDDGFEADVSAESLARTTLGQLKSGARVHLERAVPLGGRMGGHSVLGHVDGIATVRQRTKIGSAVELGLVASSQLARYLALKGSVALNGASLTLNSVVDEPARASVRFTVMLVPHTLGRTTLGELRPGSSVNIEVDVLARYVARGLALGADADWRGHSGETGDTDAPHDDDERLLRKLRSGGYA